MNMQLDVCASGGNEALRRSSGDRIPACAHKWNFALRLFHFLVAVRDTKVCGPAWAASQETPEIYTPEIIRAACMRATAQDGMKEVVTNMQSNESHPQGDTGVSGYGVELHSTLGVTMPEGDKS